MQDIWQNVFAHCHKQEVGRCASVCKEWRQLSERFHCFKSNTNTTVMQCGWSCTREI